MKEKRGRLAQTQDKDCSICAFENPKLTVTGVAIKDNKVLVVKRNEKPFLGWWDFVGGYVQKEETPDQALKREIKEELDVSSELTYLGAFTGTASYQKYKFPIISLAYLVELLGKITLNEENSEIAWKPLSRMRKVAFDSNRKILRYLKKSFVYDSENIKKLILQLDPRATFKEQSLYKAMLNGYVSKIERSNKIVGMGWIFPRQTLLRRQAVIEDMVVEESQRGKGLGEKILRDLLRWAKKQNVEVVELTTNPKRIAANNLYKKVGFKLHETNHYLLDLGTTKV